MNKPNSFFIRQLIWCYLLVLLGLIVTIFMACLSPCKNYIFAFILYLPFPTIVIWFTKFIIDAVMNTSKKGIKKGWVVTIAILMYMSKYIVAVLPIVIGELINLAVGNEIFSLISLIVVVLIYPTSSLLSQIRITKTNQNK